MEVIALRDFNDLKECVLRKQGERFDATKERIEEINSAGYGDLVEAVAGEKRTTRKAAAKAAATKAD